MGRCRRFFRTLIVKRHRVDIRSSRHCRNMYKLACMRCCGKESVLICLIERVGGSLIRSSMPFFILRDIKIHLDIPFSVRHALSPFFIRVWDNPNKHSSFSGKKPENTKNRKRVFACCAFHRSLTFYFLSTKYYNLENGKMAVSEKENRKMPRLNLRYRVICRGIAL